MSLLAPALAPQNSTAVRAAAGTGKTWLLTSRIIRLLLDGNEPGSILAITFTRKAAAEIHGRISEFLYELAAAEDSELIQLLEGIGAEADISTRQTARGLYEKHLCAIHGIRTTTFHAFCQDILRRFPLEADVPPGFDLIESTTEIQDSAWRALDQSASRNKDGALANALDTLLKECGGVDNTRKALDDFLSHRNDWWAYTEFESDAVASAVKRLQQLLGVTSSGDPWLELLRHTSVRKHIARYAELIDKHSIKTNKTYRDYLAKVLSEDEPTEKSIEQLQRVFIKQDGNPRKSPVSKTLAEKLGEQQAVELQQLHELLLSRLLEVILTDKRQQTLSLSWAWYVCGSHLLDHYQRIKSNRGMLDFADLEWKTYCLLNRSRHADWVQYKLDQRINHLLIDEFQDTNPTQWQLMLPLMTEIVAGDPERKRSVFLVGDEKQSIYRFRRADPRLFHTASTWLQDQATAHTLTQNASWRSSPAITQFVNLVFDRSGVKDEISDQDYVLPDFRTHDTHRGNLWGQVEILPLIHPTPPTLDPSHPSWRNPLEQPRLVDEDTRHQEEGKQIAKKILELMGTPLASPEGVRPLTGGDIMILLRQRTHASFYEEALRQAGIPYVGAEQGGFIEALEVRDILHLLRNLIEPYNDLALASALRSPVFGASDADLVLLAQQDSGTWRERLAKITPQLNANSVLARAQELLARWSAEVDRLPVHDLLDRIYHQGNVVARYLAASVPHQRTKVEANLNRMLDLALETDSGRYPSLSHFLYSLERYTTEDNSPQARGDSAQESRVRVMTIHAAKGLESPVVFLADSAKNTDRTEKAYRALVHWAVNDPRPGNFHLIGPKSKIDDISASLVESENELARREDANLLYVALTRAKQMLFISGCEPKRGGRGWYGFIEKQLKAASLTGNRFLKVGEPPSLPANIPHQTAKAYRLDPRLTEPLSAQSVLAVRRPSQLPFETDGVPSIIQGNIESRRRRQQRGIVLHRLLDLLTKTLARATTQQQVWRENQDWLEKAEFDQLWQEACGTVDNPSLRDLFDPSCYREARNEVAILYHDGIQEVDGVLDRLVVRDEEIVVVDYKTHRNATIENMSTLAEQFRDQMNLYGEGVKKLWADKKVKLVLLFTACGGRVNLSF